MGATEVIMYKVHCKYIACKKGNFSIPFFPILFQCIKGSENNVKLILE